jgi:hypothetical protein
MESSQSIQRTIPGSISFQFIINALVLLSYDALSTGPRDTDLPPQNRTESDWNFPLLLPGLMKWTFHVAFGQRKAAAQPNSPTAVSVRKYSVRICAQSEANGARPNVTKPPVGEPRLLTSIQTTRNPSDQSEPFLSSIAGEKGSTVRPKSKSSLWVRKPKANINQGK